MTQNGPDPFPLTVPARPWKRILLWVSLVMGLSALTGLLLLLRLPLATDYLYHSLVKDPDRHPPAGRVIVAPADGTILYIRRVTGGVIPEVVKQGVPVPLVDHLKMEPLRPFPDGWLVGIFMNTQGVHVNRVPDHGTVKHQHVWNGPHLDMTAAEREIILAQLLPGAVTLKKLLGRPPFDLQDKADFILRSARETLVLEDARGLDLYLVRIADYYVGRILTWIQVGESVSRGQKLGMITWGSQTDLFFASSPGLQIRAEVGQYVYGGESVLASY
ncbi:MAG: phosphatidylserine decarboxylase [Candidatus Riflebacteria bacterium]|nr:phosphatidylserine decarboxylase [Candidatus Riflebacteria bacterium]